MHPELFYLFGIGFPSYFVLLLSGFLFATALGSLWARRIGENGDVIVDLGIAMLLAGVAGARLLHVLADGFFWDYVHLCTNPALVDWAIDPAECTSAAFDGAWDVVKGVCHPRHVDCFAWAKFWAGGLTYYGGLVGASIAAWFLLRRDQFPFWKAADMAGIAIPLGLAFGRLGCLLAGCCFGVTCDLPWAVSFPWRSAASEEQFKDHLIPTAGMWSLPVQPTQIYEAVASLAIAGICLLWVHSRKRYDGQVLVVSLTLYAVARFLVEFLRRDDRGGLFGLSTSQIIGVALIGFAAAVHAVRGQPRRAGRENHVHDPSNVGSSDGKAARP